MCRHKNTTTTAPRCYGGSVAGLDGDENPAAHGGITYSEICAACGAEREVNANGCHHEYSSWYRPAARGPRT